MRWLGVLAIATMLGAPNAQKPSVLDAFESTNGWAARPSDGVSVRLSSDSGFRGRAMRLDFDFHGGGGYAVVHKAFNFAVPANYEFSFRVRGEASPNTLEFKLIDPSGDNVWWSNQPAFEFSRSWTEVVRKKRHITFAWGPKGGGDLTRVAAIEISITAGTGGKGTVWIDELELRPRAPDRPYTLTPLVAATADSPGAASFATAAKNVFFEADHSSGSTTISRKATVSAAPRSSASLTYRASLSGRKM